MSNMIRCPVSCIVQVWTYSSAKAGSSISDVDQREPVEAVESPAGDVLIDGHLHQVRLRQLQHRRRR